MDVKTKILEVSLELFNEYGSENISTNEIAKKADISTGTLYYYFKNKEEIINALFMRMDREYDELFDRQIDFVSGFNKDIILFDDSDFLEKYRFFSREANILVKNSGEFKRLDRETREKREKHLYMVFKILQNQGLIIKSIKEEVIKKIIEIIYFNGIYNPLLKTLDSEDSKEKTMLRKFLPLYGFLTEKGREFFEVEKLFEDKKSDGKKA